MKILHAKPPTRMILDDPHTEDPVEEDVLVKWFEQVTGKELSWHEKTVVHHVRFKLDGNDT